MKILLLLALCAGALGIYGADAHRHTTHRPRFPDVQRTFHPRLEVTGRPPVEARIDVACLEPKYPGLCKGYFPRYYFNITTKTCEQFIYGGCQANGNNFLTIEECRNRCRYIPTRPSGEDLFTEVPLSAFRADEPELLPYKEEKISARIDVACLEPKKPGRCDGYFPRYYFNITTKTCEEFIYGGCQGNGNNFETLEECTNRCRYIRTRTSRGEGSTETPFSAFRDDESELSPYQGRTSARIDVACLDPKKPGPCAGYFPRYYFNITTKTCEQFIYGGCQGNGNNFETIEEYIPSEITNSDTFTPEVPYMAPSVYREPTDVPPYYRVSARIDIACREPKYPGPCKGYFPRYYYNNITKTCEEFIYGGCQGNGNNFVTLEECKNRCWASLEQAHTPITNAFDLPVWPFKPPEVCTYPADSGPCKAYIPRFFYNTLTKACEEFIYGGCGGNKNNFLTFDQCDKKCKKIIGVIPRA